MKEFHYRSSGLLAGRTMTVKELREELLKYPEDLPVFGGLEGFAGFITPEDFSVRRVHKGDPEEACPCLIIDVENY